MRDLAYLAAMTALRGFVNEAGQIAASLNTNTIRIRLPAYRPSTFPVGERQK